MKLSTDDINRFRGALSVAGVIDTHLAVVADGKIMGVNHTRDAAIISELQLLPAGVKMGIGRVDELTKRLSLFGENVEAELKLNDKEEVVLLTLTSGRTKLQFRCTSMGLLEKKYPKENADTPAVIVTLSKEETAQLHRGVRAFSAEAVVVKVDRGGAVHLECVDSNNDRFALTLETAAEFLDREPESIVFMYRGDALASILVDAARDGNETSAIIGEGGSLAVIVRGHTLIIMPKANGE